MERFTFTRLQWIVGPEGHESPDPRAFEATRAFCRGRNICYLCGHHRAGELYDYIQGMHRCRDYEACDVRYDKLRTHPVTVRLTVNGFEAETTQAA